MSIDHSLQGTSPKEQSQQVEVQALNAFRALSPLYTQLYTGMEHDPEVLALLAHADRNQQIYVLFFSIINFLLLRDRQRGEQPLLANFYPNLTPTPQPLTDVYPIFRTFVLAHAEEIRVLMKTQRLQTNEVTRCANLLPAFELVSRRGNRKPLALIEIGASAGLNLLWDRYGYNYTPGGYAGERASSVQIHSALRGTLIPPIPCSFPPVTYRVGIDLNPLDVCDEEQALWLQAFIWPEEKERFQVLRDAITLAQQSPPKVIAGNALDHLAAILSQVPEDTTICVYHSFALSQAPITLREQIFQTVVNHAQDRDVFRISLEIYLGWQQPRMELFTYHQAKEIQQELLASCSLHGDWMEWLLFMPQA